jgi:hypothetical protein
LSTFEKIIKNQLGQYPGTSRDPLMNVLQATEGSYWYIPSLKELNLRRVSGERWKETNLRNYLGIDWKDQRGDLIVPFWQVRSKNGYMFYNSHDYLLTMGSGKYKPGDPPSPRVLSLLANTFMRWNDSWYFKPTTPRIPHLEKYLSKDEKRYLNAPVVNTLPLFNLLYISP